MYIEKSVLVIYDILHKIVLNTVFSQIRVSLFSQVNAIRNCGVITVLLNKNKSLRKLFR